MYMGLISEAREKAINDIYVDAKRDEMAKVEVFVRKRPLNSKVSQKFSDIYKRKEISVHIRSLVTHFSPQVRCHWVETTLGVRGHEEYERYEGSNGHRDFKGYKGYTGLQGFRGMLMNEVLQS